MLQPEKLHFATAGIPHAIKKGGYPEALKYNLENGLMGMELEFVHGVKMSPQNIPIIKEFAIKNKMILTAHGPFYINLNTQEEEKYIASVNRILDTARMSHLCGCYSITFHAAFYMKQDPKSVYNKVKESLTSIISTLKGEKINIWVRPELTGKGSQFGSLDELIQLSKEIDMVLPCIDFAHMHARLNGFNNYDKFAYILDKIGKELGDNALNNFHGHVAGIEYTAKGERRHLNLLNSDFNYQDLLKALKHFDVKGVLVCESPNIEEDTALLAKTYQSLCNTECRIST